MENREELLTPGTKQNEAEKSFGPFSPLEHDMEYRELLHSPMITPKRRLSLNMDESMQSSTASDVDAGYGESIGSCSENSNDGLTSESVRSPLGELDANSPYCINNRRILQAKRLKKRSSSNENCSGQPSSASSAPRVFSFPAIQSTQPSSLPSSTENLPLEGTRRSWIRQISSPLERMTLLSPTGQVIFSFEPQTSTGSSLSHTSSTQSLPVRSSSITSTTESDGYFSEIDVFDSKETADQTSDAIKSLINAPLTDINEPITFSSAKQRGLPCPTPVRPQRSNSSPQPFCTIKRKSSLKRSSPASELAQLQKPKRPPPPFLHCSNSQDSAMNTVASSPLSRQLKGRTLLRSQSYCLPPVIGECKPVSPCPPKELIGDETMPYVLPLVKGSVPELKCISPDTLSKLLTGHFEDKVNSFQIIDCRYPYEFKGGHIRGAINIWEKPNLEKKFFTSPKHPIEGKRNIYIFHCEFSSKRGPEMCRFLRELDRTRNGMEFFPKLYYPELYLLEGGYRAFFTNFSEFCEPKSYCLMLDEKYKEDLRHFKQRAKSWAGDSILQNRRQVPGKCRRRTTVNFGSPPQSTSKLSSPKSEVSIEKSGSDA